MFVITSFLNKKDHFFTFYSVILWQKVDNLSDKKNYQCKLQSFLYYI